MLAWLQNTFPTGVLYEGDNSSVSFDTTDQNGLFTSITSSPPTYAELSALPCAINGNWQYIFDQWKTKGLIV